MLTCQPLKRLTGLPGSSPEPEVVRGIECASEKKEEFGIGTDANLSADKSSDRPPGSSPEPEVVRGASA